MNILICECQYSDNRLLEHLIPGDFFKSDFLQSIFLAIQSEVSQRRRIFSISQDIAECSRSVTTKTNSQHPLNQKV